MANYSAIYDAHRKADAGYIAWLDSTLLVLTGAQANGTPVARHWRLRDLERMSH